MRKLADWLPPLVHRELLGSSRKAWTYWLRFLITLGAVVVLLIIGVIQGNRLSQNEGLQIFVPLVGILFVTASFTGLRSTADCVSRERRDGTLGLLFLTDLRLSTILFSKLLSHSIQNVWALLAVLPVLGVCVLLGGVSGRLYLQGVLSILAALALSLAVGLRHSCAHEDDHRAFSIGLRHVLLLNLLPLFSPFGLLIVSFWQGSGPILYFWISFLAVATVAIAYWMDAQRSLARNWHGEVEKVKTIWSEPDFQDTFRMGHLRKPTKLCGESDPARWIISRYGDFRQASPKGIGWAFSGTLLIVVPLMVGSQVFEYFSSVYLVIMGCARFVQILAMGKVAPQSFAEVTGQGALEILQTTPVTLRQLIVAARAFLFSEYKKGVLPMIVLDLVAAVWMVVFRRHDARNFLGQLLLQNCIFFAALPGVGLAGIWLGIKHASFARAAFRTTLLFVFLPLTAFFFGDFRLVSVYLTIGYTALAVVMAYRLRLLMQGGDCLLKVVYR